MRRSLLSILMILLAAMSATAQEKTARVTAYAEFQPATVYQTNGGKLALPKANIFLKSSSLLYQSGKDVKEANLKTVERVDFKDRSYQRIDSVLAYVVDSVGSNVLYCAKRIDVTAYQQLLRNSKTITNLDMSWMLNYATIDVTDNDDYLFPLVPTYYYRLNGKYVLVHERNLRRVLNKDQRRIMDTLISLSDFSWTNEKCLLDLLRRIN